MHDILPILVITEALENCNSISVFDEDVLV